MSSEEVNGRIAPNLANRCRAQWEYAHGVTQVQSLPPELHLGLTNDCNFHCPYCIDHYVGNTRPRTRIEGEVRRRMLDLVPRICALAFHGISEFMLDKEFFAILDRCAAANVTFLVNTNGSVCTPKHVDALAAYPAGLQVNFSLDAATPETFRIMRGWDFERVLANVRTYVAALRSRRTGRPTHLQASLVVARCNMHEVVDFVRLAHSLGLDSAICKPLHPYEGLTWVAQLPDGGTFDYQQQLPSLEPRRFDEALRRAKLLADELQFPVELPAPFGAELAPESAGTTQA